MVTALDQGETLVYVNDRRKKGKQKELKDILLFPPIQGKGHTKHVTNNKMTASFSKSVFDLIVSISASFPQQPTYTKGKMKATSYSDTKSPVRAKGTTVKKVIRDVIRIPLVVYSLWQIF